MSEEQTFSPVVRRAPEQVMKLERLGAFHQSRLSFMRQLTRRMKAEKWHFSRPIFAINNKGYGHAVYQVKTPSGIYSLVAFAHDLPAEKRSDRVIAEAWDATFSLVDGEATPDDIARLAQNVPFQEAGRISAHELSLSRANRSVRLWAHVVEALAKGQQPDRQKIEETGYLMRTTAVYGSGKFGAADYQMIASQSGLSAPFQNEMLSVYLTRCFVRDLVEHIAHAQGGERAVGLCPAIAKRLGIGNSTGLGMAPFIVNHPVLFHNWINAREEALALVRSLVKASASERALFTDLLGLFSEKLTTWQTNDQRYCKRVEKLRKDIACLQDFLAARPLKNIRPWDELYRWAEVNLGVEAQEALVALMLEPYGELVDALAAGMADGRSFEHLDGTMRIGKLRELLSAHYGWALAIDWQKASENARVWYVSVEKLEPRLGQRFEEDLAPYEQPLAPGRDAAALFHALVEWPDDACLADFMLACPGHRYAALRAQIVAQFPYSEIQDNLISADLIPVDMLRCKLSFFGAQNFDPRSDRWLRISMYANAPYPEDLTEKDADFWPYGALHSI